MSKSTRVQHCYQCAYLWYMVNTSPEISVGRLVIPALMHTKDVVRIIMFIISVDNSSLKMCVCVCVLIPSSHAKTDLSYHMI